MWIGAERGRALQIIEIDTVNTSSDTLICVAEDVDRYNLINDPDAAGSGALPQGMSIYMFTLSNDGLPILSPVTSVNFSQTFVSDMMGRFIGLNPADEFIEIHQPDHGMILGDIIRVDHTTGLYTKAVGDKDVDQILGIVTLINVPGVEYFSFRPLGKKIENVSPPLIGNPGDTFYVSPTDPGKFTKTRPNRFAKPIYLRMNTPTEAILLNNPRLDASTVYKMFVTPTDGQTIFDIPVENATTEIVSVAINGIECSDWTFDVDTQILTYQALDYPIDSNDEVLIVYKT